MIKKLHGGYIHLMRLAAAAIAIGWCANVFAAGFFSSDDAEKPNPVFTRNGDRIKAKLIPRAKSTSVEIEFQVTAGGMLDNVKGVDFASVDRPDVDIKNFKSAVFEIEIRDVARGGTATVALRSDFFTLSTAFYIFNPKRTNPWIRDAQSENRDLPRRVRELVVLVQDGGDFDADGLADGHIEMVGGPRDSFWGYALGTLFIRFFGIFFVLSLLMFGMLVSGWIFKAIDRFKGLKQSASQDRTGPAAAIRSAVQPTGELSGTAAPIPEEVVASIAAALYLRDTVSRSGGCATSAAQPGVAWTMAGRTRLMNDRLVLFNPARRNRP
jgi:hypothetical protein